jgi:hypothetical protein
MEWLDRHFGLHVFSEVHFGNHFAMHGTSRTKAQICREVGADVLIDDNPAYAYDCALHGLHVLLFNWNMRYPWSSLPDKCDPEAGPSRVPVVSCSPFTTYRPW